MDWRLENEGEYDIPPPAAPLAVLAPPAPAPLTEKPPALGGELQRFSMAFKAESARDIFSSSNVITAF